MTRLLIAFLLSALPTLSQSFTFGVKAGVPFTPYLEIGPGSPFASYHTEPNPYILGPTVEWRTASGLGIELDALYRHLNYSNRGKAQPGFSVFKSDATANAWEFPLLAKYRLGSKTAAPFLDLGIAVDVAQGVSQTTTVTTFLGSVGTTATSHPSELRSRAAAGLVMGGGVDVHLRPIHIQPEIRYTNWLRPLFRDPYAASGPLPFSTFESNRQQVEFLVGITF